jgi:hypothetical protein
MKEHRNRKGKEKTFIVSGNRAQGKQSRFFRGGIKFLYIVQGVTRGGRDRDKGKKERDKRRQATRDSRAPLSTTAWARAALCFTTDLIMNAADFLKNFYTNGRNEYKK